MHTALTRAQNIEKRDEGWSTQRREMRDGVRKDVWEFWTKCEGLRGCFTPFFFFFNFGLTWPFRPIPADSAVSADTGRFGRYGPSRPDLGRVGADFSRVGPIRESPRGTMRHGRASVASLPHRRVPPRRTRVRWPRSRVRASQVLTRCQLFQNCCLQGIVQELQRRCCRCSCRHRPGR